MSALAQALTLNCWLVAAQTTGLPPSLLYAVSEVESSRRPHAVAKAPNGTYSVGMMQINSSWFPRLLTVGIRPADLLRPCTNIQVGSWILAGEVNRYGYTWEAIGAYYAGPYDARSERWKHRQYREYAQKVFQAWRRIESRRERVSVDRGAGVP